VIEKTHDMPRFNNLGELVDDAEEASDDDSEMEDSDDSETEPAPGGETETTSTDSQ
jgi:hypothetical protein